MNIIEFLEARIAEDEAQARECLLPENLRPYSDPRIPPIAPERWGDLADNYLGGDMGRYCKRFTPLRILAECAGKRRIIAAQHWTPKARPTDQELHATCSHPAYEYAITEGQRKRWDDADKPPEGWGWERNVDCGRGGWERFEYHEESYWRRTSLADQGKEWEQYIPVELRALAAVYKDHPDYHEEWAA